MRRALRRPAAMPLFALLLLTFAAVSCAQQDAALSVTLSGQYRVPQDADKLSLDVFDGPVVIRHKEWCASGCDDVLAPQASFAGTLTLVESGAAHPHVKLNAQLRKLNSVVGLGTAQADFHDGQTGEVTIALTP